ncbi:MULTISPECIES: PPOX class F420-dependent oxidoreductase [Saccharothrix]|uniref:PPOX class F420-dependent enzyme n=2 Tax=Saccharothrix TaxID=2071 RepID=A0ABU0X843_9PSEU|nr:MULTISPECIES: PPOX class F420-dependent oxidoreductase [Saccharothrix]MDQ2588141.1 PPOX class F420-dependent enzyme [Saccharothrix yanglingensis]MDR6595905.1 PPOX class probable F420-dependent enzyme [Saccharothrix longispora]
MDLGDGKYLLLTTFRRSGVAVPTPVWVAHDGSALYAWSAADAGKVKRIRNNGEVRIGPCDVRGRPTGEQVPARASLMDREGSERVRSMIARKYGLFGRITLLGSRLRRGPEGTVGIEIHPSTGS